MPTAAMGKELDIVQDPEFAFRAALLRWHPMASFKPSEL